MAGASDCEEVVDPKVNPDCEIVPMSQGFQKKPQVEKLPRLWYLHVIVKMQRTQK